MKISTIVFALVAATTASGAFAQAAGAGADFNKADRSTAAEQAEVNRLIKYDKPVYKDPLGNALIGAPTTGLIRGAAAGVSSIVTGTAIGTASNAAKNR
ncbi:MAG: hypothetical protein ABIQ06_06210 [Caldimonas sp.]